MESAPSPDILTNFFTGLGLAVMEGLRGLIMLMLSAFVASPAITSMLQLRMSRRWPLLQTSWLLSGVCGAVLTFVTIYAIIIFFAVLDGKLYDLNKIYPVLSLAAVVIVLTALWVQYSNRASFNLARVVWIAASIAVPTTILLIGP